ncbi:rod shape-determining protein MreD [bacterium]|nr:rod shape-determining protein MreD [bacterium]MBU1637484.1 rod shape-determining protein MreD [bacterium]MBU1919917.1 rod shape-determining protein MreD [bacterium]
MTHLIPVIVGIILLAANLGLGGLLEFGTIRPSLILPFVVYLSLRRGAVYGIVAGFLIGLCADSMGGTALGATSLAFCAAGFLPGRFWSSGPFRVHWPWGVSVLICALIFELVRNLIMARETGAVFSILFFQSGVPSALYTTLLSVIWFLSPLNRDRSI